tara:strand:- start:351 stop:986 length:636 start_codon:yes stop_codon:yes gene_type:complete
MKSIILKQHDILALKEGRKTQYRAVVKPQPLPDMTYTGFTIDGSKKEIGRFRWVKEPVYVWVALHKVIYADSIEYVSDLTKEDIDRIKSDQKFLKAHKKITTGNWLKVPAPKMPKMASRFTLEITGVRVERLQDISEEDAIAEGVESWLDSLPNDFRKLRGILCDNYHAIQYRQLWESINGKGSWEANPWVWVLDFIVHNKNIDEVINEKA